MFLYRVAVPVLDGLRVLVCVVVFLASIDGILCVLGLRLGLRLGLEIEVRASCCEGPARKDPGDMSEWVICGMDVVTEGISWRTLEKFRRELTMVVLSLSLLLGLLHRRFVRIGVVEAFLIGCKPVVQNTALKVVRRTLYLFSWSRYNNNLGQRLYNRRKEVVRDVVQELVTSLWLGAYRSWQAPSRTRSPNMDSHSTTTAS
jgi:hypothetical protein